MGVGGVTNIRFACLFPVLLRTGHCIGMLNTASDFASYSFGFEGLAGDLSETLETSSLFLCPLTRLGSCGLTAWLIESWQCLTTENLILGLAFVVAFQFSFIRKLVSKEGASVFMNTFLCIFFWAIINQIWQNWSWKFTVLSYRESPGHHCGRETWASVAISTGAVIIHFLLLFLIKYWEAFFILYPQDLTNGSIHWLNENKSSVLSIIWFKG